MSQLNRLHGAIRFALFGAAASTLAGVPAMAQDQDQQTTELGKQTVTGSRIRRIDVETSSPVFTIDRTQIERTGAVTLGQLIQETPVIAGAATNPQVNNGGGSGASTISLRGVGSYRTLVLVNGRRWISDPTFDAVDVNSIPINLIERVEILKDGASAIYGSDAVGGVVNFITRKEFDGFEFTALRGESSRDDAGLDNYQMALGTTTEAGHFMLGATFDKRDPVISGERPFSQDPFALYNGQRFSVGSSRTDSGYYQVPRSVAAAGGADLSRCGGTSANVVVTRRDDRPGTAISDYRCYVGTGPNNDTYDFQDVNVVVTPQERYGVFVTGERNVSESVKAFFEGAYHYTESNSQIAPEPFDGRPSQANIPIPATNIYNPFGVALVNQDLRLRLVNVGNRVSDYETNRFQVNAGFEGSVFENWRWQTSYSWGQMRQDNEEFGELYAPGLAAALGPSFRETDGTPRCGTPTAVIQDCTPINFFSVPSTPAEEAEAAASVARLVPKRHALTKQNMQIGSINVDGDLLELPAGPLSLAVGAEYREESLVDEPDFLAQNELLSNSVEGRSEGSFNVREAYAELHVPVLKDMPLAQSLELDAGIRYSDYNTFGNTSNAKFGVEWRPGGGLLLRGTYAEVFRAPTISDMFAGLSENASQFDDPCNLLRVPVGQNPNIDAACVNVPRDGTFSQTDTQATSFEGGNPVLSPEEGEVITYGVAWTPTFLSRLYTEVDFWRIELTDTIGTFGVQNILSRCFDAGLYCDFINRDPLGEVFALDDFNQNVGALQTEGIDIALQYSFPESRVGKFRTRLDSTYLIKYDNEQVTGDPASTVREAGRFVETSQGGDGHFSRWRGLAAVDWTLKEFSASARARYIGTVVENTNDGCVPTLPGTCLGYTPTRKIADQVILNLQGTYRAPWGVDVTLGVDNVTDELAPLIYAGFNGTTDVRTYDGIGRFYYLRLNFKG